MEIIISTKDNKVNLSTSVEICESEGKKFDKNSDLVRNLQMDCHLEASRVKNTLKITRAAGEWVNETDIKQFKNDVKSFVSALAKMPEEEPECPSHEEQEEISENEIKFLKNIINGRNIIAARGYIFYEDGFGKFNILAATFTRMVNAYLEKYDKH